MRNLILLLPFIFFSCSSDSTDVIDTQSDYEIAAKSSNDPSNSANEFDYIGVIHNDALMEFVDTFGGVELTTYELLNEIKNILLNNNEFLEILGESSYPDITESDMEDGIDDFSNEFANTIENQPISSTAKIRLQDLVSTTINSSESYEDYYNYVVSFEEDILNSELSSEEKNGILGVASIARYSAYLWASDNSDYQVMGEGKKGGNAWWIVGADIAGGIAGGILAGPGGILSGGAAGSGMANLIISNMD